MSQLSQREAIAVLADVVDRLTMLQDGLWSLRATLRIDGRPEAVVVSELLVLCLETSEMAYAVEFNAASAVAVEAVRNAMRGRA
jgi:hypothetical protein